MTFRIYNEQSDYGRGRRLAILFEEPDGTRSVAEPMQFRRLSETEVGPWSFEDGQTMAGKGADQLLQAFLDLAWSLGMRPQGFADTTNQVKAMDAHLQDMRAIAFEKVGAEKP